MTPHRCGPTGRKPKSPSASILLTECVHIVLLVSGYRDGAVCRNGAPPLPRWQAWPQRVNVHYHTKTKCQAAPPPQPFVFLCGSVCLDTCTPTQTRSPAIIWARNDALSRKEVTLAGANLGSDTNESKAVKRNQFVPITWNWSVVLSDWLTVWATDWIQLSERLFIWVLSVCGATNL